MKQSSKIRFKVMLRLLAWTLTMGMVLPFMPVLPTFAQNANSSQPAQKEEPRKTPLMGWASWNAYRTDISEEIILSQAEKLVELGLKDLGYVFVNVDDGWQNALKHGGAKGYSCKYHRAHVDLHRANEGENRRQNARVHHQRGEKMNS